MTWRQKTPCRSAVIQNDLSTIVYRFCLKLNLLFIQLVHLHFGEKFEHVLEGSKMMKYVTCISLLCTYFILITGRKIKHKHRDYHAKNHRGKIAKKFPYRPISFFTWMRQVKACFLWLYLCSGFHFNSKIWKSSSSWETSWR